MSKKEERCMWMSGILIFISSELRRRCSDKGAKSGHKMGTGSWKPALPVGYRLAQWLHKPFKDWRGIWKK
jgi:hypothetical protein